MQIARTRVGGKGDEEAHGWPGLKLREVHCARTSSNTLVDFANARRLPGPCAMGNVRGNGEVLRSRGRPLPLREAQNPLPLGRSQMTVCRLKNAQKGASATVKQGQKVI
jgi:hypothetical protein